MRESFDVERSQRQQCVPSDTRILIIGSVIFEGKSMTWLRSKNDFFTVMLILFEPWSHSRRYIKFFPVSHFVQNLERLTNMKCDLLWPLLTSLYTWPENGWQHADLPCVKCHSHPRFERGTLSLQMLCVRGGDARHRRAQPGYERAQLSSQLGCHVDRLLFPHGEDLPYPLDSCPPGRYDKKASCPECENGNIPVVRISLRPNVRWLCPSDQIWGPNTGCKSSVGSGG